MQSCRAYGTACTVQNTVTKTADPKREGLGRWSQEALPGGALLPRLLPLGDSMRPPLPRPLGDRSLLGGAELLCWPYIATDMSAIGTTLASLFRRSQQHVHLVALHH